MNRVPTAWRPSTWPGWGAGHPVRAVGAWCDVGGTTIRGSSFDPHAARLACW